MVQDYISAREQYELFLSKPGSQKLLDGYLLINENDKTFAVSTDSYDRCINFQSASYDNIDSITINEGSQTRRIKMKDGDSGAAGAVFGGLLFGPVGALAGGLATREDNIYEQYQAVNLGLTITYTNTSHIDIDVLNSCFNRPHLDYQSDRVLYDKAKQLTIQIYEELSRRIHSSEGAESDISDSISSDAENSGTTRSTKQTEQQTLNININPDNVEPTITRIELFLEDKEWEKAKAYAEAALDFFPTDYRLYLFLMFADLQVSDYDELGKCTKSIPENRYYKKVIRFADDAVIEKLQNCSTSAYEAAEIEGTYVKAVQSMENQEYVEAYQLFASLGEYKDAKEKALECTEKHAEYAKKKKQEQKEFAERERKASAISAAIEERNRLLEKFKRESPDDSSLRERIEALDDLFLQQADIIKNQNKNYVFEGYVFPYWINFTLDSDTNEWLLIGREEDKILFLSKYYVREHVLLGRKYFYSDTIGQMISGFTIRQRFLIESLKLLSTEEVETYLPNESDRLLRNDDGTIIEWILNDNASQNRYAGINREGMIVKGKSKWAVRPAIWIDLKALKPTESICFDDPHYERVEYERYGRCRFGTGERYEDSVPGIRPVQGVVWAAI